MTDVFLSYSRRDREYAEKLAAQLGEFDLWWDRELLSGAAYVSEINTQLGKAGCILVLWSPDSLKSRWVTAEAMEGFDSERLVQVGLKVMPLVPFRILHCTRLEGDPSPADVEALKQAIRSTLRAARAATDTGSAAAAIDAAPAPPMPSPEERAKAVKAMDTAKYTNLIMGFSAGDLLLAVMLVALGAGVVIANLVAPIPETWVNNSLIGAAVLCGLGVLLMLKTTFSYFRSRG